MTEPDHPASAEPGRGPSHVDEGAGLRDEYPRLSGVGVAVGAGGLWGVLCYSVLWEGRPFGVDRPFVESVFGTLLLLPARLVLWVIRWIELLTERTFDLSRNHLWIGLVTSAVGAVLALLVFLAARVVWRRIVRGRLAP
jgi:hypothetical protein